MKFEKVVTVNIGNYESVKLGVSDADSWQACDVALETELSRLGLKSRGCKLDSDFIQ